MPAVVDTPKKSRSLEVAADVTALLLARNPLLWIVTREEARVEGYLFEAAAAAKYEARTWDLAQGFADMQGNVVSEASAGDPSAALNYINARAKSNDSNNTPGVWIMRDFAPLVTGPIGMMPCRQLRNLARTLPTVDADRSQAVIVLTPSAEVPPELSGHATVIDWPLPDRAEIANILDGMIEDIPDETLRKSVLPKTVRDAAIDAAVGLSGEEATACYAKSLVQLRRIDPAIVTNEKKRIIKGVLEWYDPLPGGLDAVGGLDVLKDWLISRSMAYTPEAREYGLKAPRGALVVGIQGCGKSLIAKAVATAWGVPLLRLDLGALKDKYVGGSESNIRRALAIVDVLGRCVLWPDEIEKALEGATQGAADGGVSADALGTLLTWMQERKSEAFVLATANDISKLPPELLRKGRFDKIWWVDTPNKKEIVEILAATLRANGREKAKIDLQKVAAACTDFIGAEVAELVPEAMFFAYADKNREMTTEDLLRAAEQVRPLTETAAEKIKGMREWAKNRAQSATTPETVEPMTMRRGRNLGL